MYGCVALDRESVAKTPYKRRSCTDICTGSIVCSKQLYKEALGHDYDEPKQWELREINDIMNNAVTGWRAFSNPRYFPEPYRRQKGWERIRNDNEPDNSMDGFQEIPTEEMEQLGLPEEWLKQK